MSSDAATARPCNRPGCPAVSYTHLVLSYIVPAPRFFAALLRLLLMLNSLAQLFFYYGVAAHSTGVTRQWANLVIGIILISALLSWFVTDVTLALVLTFGQIGAQAILCCCLLYTARCV